MKPLASIPIHANSPVPVPIQIADWFRSEILKGNFQPGQKLPSNGEIAAQAGASCTAVQKAFATLTLEGLVTRRPRRGTFVSEADKRPTILLVFGVNLMQEAAYFYRTMNQAFVAEAARRRVHLKSFFLPLESCPELLGQQTDFQEAIRMPGVAGALLFAIDPARIAKVLKKIPQALYQPGDPVNDLLFDNRHFFETALGFFESAKRRRIAFACSKFESVGYSGGDIDLLLSQISHHDLLFPQLIPLVLPNSGREHEGKAYRIMLEACSDWEKTGKCPQGILVNDDILMRPVSLALARGNYDIPSKMAVVVRTIEEVDHHYAVPVFRYAISAREVAQVLFQRLWDRRAHPERKFAPLIIRGKIQDSAV